MIQMEEGKMVSSFISGSSVSNGTRIIPPPPPNSPVMNPVAVPINGRIKYCCLDKEIPPTEVSPLGGSIIQDQEALSTTSLRI